jgi:plasmid stabilization system protein ParE
MGWLQRPGYPHLKPYRMFRISGFEKVIFFYRSLPGRGIEILRISHGSRNLGPVVRTLH